MSNLETFCTALGGFAGTMFGLTGFLAGPAVGLATTSGGAALGSLGGRVVGRLTDDFHAAKTDFHTTTTNIAEIKEQMNTTLRMVNNGLGKGESAWRAGEKVISVLSSYWPEVVGVIVLTLMQGGLEEVNKYYKFNNIQQISTMLEALGAYALTFRLFKQSDSWPWTFFQALKRETVPSGVPF